MIHSNQVTVSALFQSIVFVETKKQAFSVGSANVPAGHMIPSIDGKFFKRNEKNKYLSIASVFGHRFSVIYSHLDYKTDRLNTYKNHTVDNTLLHTISVRFLSAGSPFFTQLLLFKSNVDVKFEKKYFLKSKGGTLVSFFVLLG